MARDSLIAGLGRGRGKRHIAEVTCGNRKVVGARTGTKQKRRCGVGAGDGREGEGVVVAILVADVCGCARISCQDGRHSRGQWGATEVLRRDRVG
eukprot:13741281-Heterocapsa_arctica.AAC.1